MSLVKAHKMVLISAWVTAAALFFWPAGVNGATVYSEPFFVTVERVDLKNQKGDWIKVIEPDHRFDLITETPVVQFFNNGRIKPGAYANVRVVVRIEGHPHPVIFDKREDFAPPVEIQKNSYVRVQFDFDFMAGVRTLNERTVYQVKLTVDEEERLEKGSDLRFFEKEDV